MNLGGDFWTIFFPAYCVGPLLHTKYKKKTSLKSEDWRHRKDSGHNFYMGAQNRM